METLVRQARQYAKRNSATILTCIGGVGVVATSVMAVKATPKALALIEEAKEEKGKELTKWEIVKVATPSYIPAVTVGLATLACVFGANALNMRQQASLMSAYALLDQSYKEYRSKVEDIYGEAAHGTIVQEIAKDKYEDEDLIVTEDKELFYDTYSRRYFEATMADVIHAEYEINKRLAVEACACLNEFYDLLGVPELEGGDEIGWNIYQLVEETWFSWLDFQHEKVVMDDGLECTLITVCFEPGIDFTDY